jgi:hypothetical protein
MPVYILGRNEGYYNIIYQGSGTGEMLRGGIFKDF